MRLSDYEQSMLAGEMGELRRKALVQQIEVGRFFDAEDLVEVAQAWMLHTMKERRMAPAALLLNHANPIIAQGAAFAGFPLIDRFEHDITSMIKTGDPVHVDPVPSIVTVEGKDKEITQ